MESKEKNLKADKSLQKLSLSIGDFIRYWGFRRIHGAIWTQLYLSEKPLSCTDLTRKLSLSKALISPAIDELCKYKLIREAPALNKKTKIYEASENIHEVIQDVLKVRESKMLKKITNDFTTFINSGCTPENLSETRVKSLGEMILSANIMLEILMSQKSILDLPFELKK